MEKQVNVMKRMYRKGLVETGVFLLAWMFLRVGSWVRVWSLKLRGYTIERGVTIFGSAHFFQSTKGAIQIHKGSEIRRNTRISAGFDGHIVIGRYTLIDEGTQIMAQQQIIIGDNVLIAPFCFLTDFNHRYDNTEIPMSTAGYVRKPIVIENDVWIGTHSIILPGVTVGRGTVIGAGSVVTKHVQPYSIVAGNPARVIRRRA